MSRRLRLGLLVLAAGAAGVVLVVLLLRALIQPGLRFRWDFAGTSPMSLSERSAAAAAALPAASRATFFLLREEEELLVNRSAVYPKAFAVLRVAAEELRIKSRGRVEVELLEEGTTAPVDFAAAWERLGRQRGETVFLEAGGQRQVLRFDELFRYDRPNLSTGAAARLHGHRVDEALGDAALRLGRGELRRIAVLAAALPPSVPAAALDPLLRLFGAEGYHAERVERAPAPDEGWDLLVVPGQAVALPPADVEAIEAWLAADRPLFVSLGYLAPPEVLALWNRLLAARGVAFRDGLVCAPFRGQTGDSRVANSVQIPFERIAPNHAVTAALHADRRWLLVQAAQALELAGGAPERLRVPLAWFDGEAWIETEAVPNFHPDPGEPRGSFPVLVASSRLADSGDGTGRAILSGAVSLLYASDVDGNDVFPPGARDLLAAAARWLLGEDEASSGLVALESLPFRPDPVQHARLANLAILALPGVSFLLGILVLWRRRR